MASCEFSESKGFQLLTHEFVITVYFKSTQLFSDMKLKKRNKIKISSTSLWKYAVIHNQSKQNASEHEDSDSIEQI